MVEGAVFVGVSADGFLARPDGSFDFLTGGSDPGEGDAHGFHAFLATVDALVMGRNTYEVVLPMGSWPYGTTPVFVLTHRPLPPAPAGAVVEPEAGEPAEVAARLAARGFRRLYVDGGSTIQQFLRAGLVRRLIVTQVPVLIGKGIPLFGDLPDDLLLEHVETRVLLGAAVQTEWRVRGPRGAQAR